GQAGPVGSPERRGPAGDLAVRRAPGAPRVTSTGARATDDPRDGSLVGYREERGAGGGAAWPPGLRERAGPRFSSRDVLLGQGLAAGSRRDPAGSRRPR